MVRSGQTINSSLIGSGISTRPPLTTMTILVHLHGTTKSQHNVLHPTFQVEGHHNAQAIPTNGLLFTMYPLLSSPPSSLVKENLTLQRYSAHPFHKSLAKSYRAHPQVAEHSHMHLKDHIVHLQWQGFRT